MKENLGLHIIISDFYYVTTTSLLVEVTIYKYLQIKSI